MGATSTGIPAVKIVPGSQSQGEISVLSSWGPWPSMPHGFVLGRKGALREVAKLDLGQLTLLLQFDVARSSEGPRQPSFGQLPTALHRPPPNPRQKTGDAPSRVSQGLRPGSGWNRPSWVWESMCMKS